MRRSVMKLYPPCFARTCLGCLFGFVADSFCGFEAISVLLRPAIGALLVPRAASAALASSVSIASDAIDTTRQRSNFRF